MKLDINENGMVELSEVYNSINLRTNAGEELSICMRDSGFEFQYGGEWYVAKDGIVQPMRKSIRGNILVNQDERPELAEVSTGNGINTEEDG